MTEKITFEAPPKKNYFSIFKKFDDHPITKGVKHLMLVFLFSFSMLGFAQTTPPLDDVLFADNCDEMTGTTISYDGASQSVLWIALDYSADCNDITIDTEGSTIDTEIGLFDEFGGLIANDDDGGTGLLSSLTINELPSGTYYIATGGFNMVFELSDFTVTSSSTSVGQITVNVTTGSEPGSGSGSAPANDLFADAIAVSCGDTVLGTTIDATLDEADAPDGADTFADPDSPWVWYSFTGTTAGETVTLSTCNAGSDFDTEIFVYTGTSGALTSVDEGYDECGSPDFFAETSFESDGSTTYYIAIGGWNVGDVGNFELSVTCEAPPACVPPTIDSAVVSEDFCDPDDGSGTFNVIVEVSDLGDSSPMFDDGTLQTAVALGTNVLGPYDSGTNVTINIDTADDACDSSLGDFTYTCPPPVPDNDGCAGALTLECGVTITGNNENATASGLDAECNGFASSSALDLFYTFEADGLSSYTVGLDDVDGGSSFDGVLFVYSGPCDDLTSIGCSDSGSPEEVTLDAPAAGTYTVRIFDYFGTGDFTLDLTCVAPPECPEPTDLAPTTQSPTATTFTWTPGGDETSWEFALSQPDATEPEPASVVNEPSGTAGHDPGQTFLVWVRAICGDNIYSDWITLEYTSPLQAPDNDLCDNAEPIDCGDTVSGTNVGATNGDGVAGDGCGSGASSVGVWYSFNGTGDTVTASTCNSTTDFDTEITVYTGACGDLTCEGNNDDDGECATEFPVGGPNLTSTFTWESEIGTTYYIYISGFDSDAIGNFDLSLTCEPPVNTPPTILGDQTITVSVEENTTDVTDVDAVDAEDDLAGIDLTYSISTTDGVDGALFNIDATTGEVSFINPPDFENPMDFGGNNGYNLRVIVTDSGGLEDFQNITVLVTDVDETPTPDNDLFADAIAVACDDTVFGTTIGATLDEADAPDGADTFADPDSPWVWYSFTGTTAGETVTLSTCNAGSDFDTEIFVYTGTSGALTSVDEGYDECGSPDFFAETSFESDGSTTYYIAIGGWNAGDVGNFELSITCEAPPACVGPTITSADVDETCNSEGSGTFDVVIEVSDLGNSSPMFDDGTTQTAVTLGTNVLGPYDSGQNVTINIDTTDDACDASLGDFTFTCPVEGPENDNCEDAEPIDCGDTVSGSTENATNSGGNGSPDVYYELEDTEAGTEVTVSLCGSSFDTYIGILDACDGTLLFFNDDSCGLQSEVTFTSDGATTYLIRVEGFASASGAYNLAISCEEPQPAPDNDLFEDAIAVSCGDTVLGTTIGATLDEADAPDSPDTPADPDSPWVWYSFTGTTAGETVTLSTCNAGSDFDTEIFVYTGTSGALTSVDEGYDECGSPDFFAETSFESDGSTTYYIAIGGWNVGDVGNFELSVTCETPDPCDLPLEDYFWTGAVSTDWTEPGNWAGGIAPGLSVYGNVYILGGAPNYPVLTQNLYVAECSNVICDPGTSITVKPNVELTNDGIVDNFNNGAVVFESDDTGTAYIGPGSGLFFGEYTVERYIPAKRAYRQLASPVFTSESISENWQQDTHITGPAGNTDGFDVTQTGNPSAYIFNNDSYLYEELANTNATNLMPGTMYHILVRGDRNTDLTNNDAPPSITTLKATGELTPENTGVPFVTSVNVPEQRFVAFGNPFQSQVDMGDVVSMSTNIDAVFYWVWDATLGTRGAYTAVFADSGIASAGDSDANQFLQAGQAAWVYTSGAGLSEVVIDQSAKDNSQLETDIFRNGSTADQGQLRLSLYESGTLANGGTATDAVLVLFDSNGNNGVDAYDAVNITNLDENFATNNDGVLLSIENRATPVDEDEIPLEINTYRSTNYTIVAQGTAIQGATAFLYDAYLNVHTEIPATGIVNYDYTVDSSLPGTVANNRFKIVFSNSVLSIDDLNIANVLMYPNPTNLGKFYLNVPLGMDDLEVTIYDVLGVELYNNTGFNSGMEITIDLGAEFSMGTYFVHLNSQGKTVTKKLIIN
ncbi:T9SS type A sorting domain-containing protein [Winogradskyella ouciana]|uniref:T9SS type A sorting domain-containing protein n=2 Tax=Winogradskyella TaxID=286104 RepID=A0A7K1GH57_9FLAO|nr:T9SS type A sorting domain-containing protein [Winogradskyella ouciana]MTE27768.1 T9SS type A sorting domain-containing protein [Winogradskyella ouciana]